MPRSPAQFQSLREATRERLLDAALVCFDKVGYQNTTIRDIAQQAGVALGLMYRHFEGKEGICIALVARAAAMVQHDVAAARGSHVVERLVSEAFATVQQHAPFWRFVHQLKVDPARPEAINEVFTQAASASRQRIVDELRAAGAANPEAHGAALFAAIDGACQHYLADPKHYPLEAVAGELSLRFAISLVTQRESSVEGSTLRRKGTHASRRRHSQD